MPERKPGRVLDNRSFANTSPSSHEYRRVCCLRRSANARGIMQNVACKLSTGSYPVMLDSVDSHLAYAQHNFWYNLYTPGSTLHSFAVN